MLTSVVSSGPISLADAALVLLMGMGVVFFGLILLLAVVSAMARFKSRTKKPEAPAQPTAAPEASVQAAPGSAGQVKLFDVPDREAAMVMAIVASQMNRPLNELRFLSIKEVQKP